jgi:hypothetical protein
MPAIEHVTRLHDGRVKDRPRTVSIRAAIEIAPAAN